jgi:Na+/H+ antiporter NhaD/arsenite permease-like protein
MNPSNQHRQRNKYPQWIQGMMVMSLLVGMFTVFCGPLLHLPWFLAVPLDLLALATDVVLLAIARESQAYYQRLVGLIYCCRSHVCTCIPT